MKNNSGWQNTVKMVDELPQGSMQILLRRILSRVQALVDQAPLTPDLDEPVCHVVERALDLTVKTCTQAHGGPSEQLQPSDEVRRQFDAIYPNLCCEE